MKKRTDDLQRTSRRRFTKAVAAALAAAPLAACAQSGNQGQNANQNSNQTNANQAAANQNKASQPDLENFRSDHEPPTLFGSSFHFEAHHALKKIDDNSSSSGRPRKRQVLDIEGDDDHDHQYGAIRYIHVCTEFKKRFTVETLPPFEVGDNVQLRLWLRNPKRNPDNGYEPIAPGAPPEVIVSGNHPHPDHPNLKTLLIESNKHLDRRSRKSAKKHRRERHEHKHSDDFRIVKWDVAKPNGTVVNPGNDSNAAGDDQYAHRYTFMIFCEGT